MPATTRRGQQWDYCDRCDIITVLSELEVQDGLKLCSRPGCRDKIDNEFHARGVMRQLDKYTRESEDRRADLYFMGESDVDYR